MNQREARRLAAHHCASVIETALSGGWDLESDHGYSESDAEKIYAAINRITVQLRRTSRPAAFPVDAETTND